MIDIRQQPVSMQRAAFKQGLIPYVPADRATKTLIWTARGLLRTLAAMMAPCSVKARGRTGENLRRRRWSQFATTSDFWRGDLEGEIRRETVEVAFDLLVEALGGNAIDGCQIDVKDHLLTAKGDDGGVEARSRGVLWRVDFFMAH